MISSLSAVFWHGAAVCNNKSIENRLRIEQGTLWAHSSSLNPSASLGQESWENVEGWDLVWRARVRPRVFSLYMQAGRFAKQRAHSKTNPTSA